jgi:hypothetical protein
MRLKGSDFAGCEERSELAPLCSPPLKGIYDSHQWAEWGRANIVVRR